MKYVLNTFSPTKFAPFRARLRSAGEDGDAAPACTSKTPTSGAPRLSQLECIKFTSIFHRGRKITFRTFFFIIILMAFNKMPGFNHQNRSGALSVRQPSSAPMRSPSRTNSISQTQPMCALDTPRVSPITFVTLLLSYL